MIFCGHSQRSTLNASPRASESGETYLADINQNHLIVVFQVHGVLLTHDIGDGLDNRVSIELVVSSYGRPDGVL
jgi:hypothetical protein